MGCFGDMCRLQGSFQDTFMWPWMIKFEFDKINLMEKIMEKIMDLMEEIMEDRVMCLDGWEMYGTKREINGSSLWVCYLLSLYK